MSGTASARFKKFEPLDTWDFLPFGDYDDLTIENIKEACEKYYKATEDSYDILASDRGPSCSKLEQIKGKRFTFFVFFNQHVHPLISPHAGHCLSTRLSPHQVW